MYRVVPVVKRGNGPSEFTYRSSGEYALDGMSLSNKNTITL